MIKYDTWYLDEMQAAKLAWQKRKGRLPILEGVGALALLTLPYFMCMQYGVIIDQYYWNAWIVFVVLVSLWRAITTLLAMAAFGNMTNEYFGTVARGERYFTGGGAVVINPEYSPGSQY